MTAAELDRLSELQAVKKKMQELLLSSPESDKATIMNLTAKNVILQDRIESERTLRVQAERRLAAVEADLRTIVRQSRESGIQAIAIAALTKAQEGKS